MTSSRTAKVVFFGVALALATVGRAPAARAQTAEELNAARQLFSEAYQDEQDKRYDQALEKFQRVAKVRESASVRYRIASVLEAMGRLREARDTFRALAAQKDTLEKKDKPIADSAADRALQIDRKIPRLVVNAPADAPADTRVAVDGASVPTGRPLELDPGDHVVQANASGKKPFEGHVKLGEGGETPFNVALEPAVATPPPQPPQEQKPNRTLAYVALGAGGVLLVTGVALLIVREGDIAYVRDHCPGDVCPIAEQGDITEKRDEAKLFGPLGGGLAVVGLAAAGAGAYLLLRKPSSSPASGGTPTAPSHGGLRIGPRMVRGGAMVGVGASF